MKVGLPNTTRNVERFEAITEAWWVNTPSPRSASPRRRYTLPSGKRSQEVYHAAYTTSGCATDEEHGTASVRDVVGKPDLSADKINRVK